MRSRYIARYIQPPMQQVVPHFFSSSGKFMLKPFGLSIAEAMAMRKPVVACNTGGVPEIITHGSDGWLVEERSAEAVATAMARLLKDPELCRQMGERARQTIRDRFMPRQQCAAVARRYAELVAAA